MGRKKMAIITVASIGMLVGAIALAVSSKQDYQLEFGVGEQEYTVNGIIKEFDEKIENLPIIEEGTNKILMPLRIVIEEMGGALSWDKEHGSTQINYKNTEVVIVEGSNHASINGYSIVLNTAPKNINGCLYVDTDFISDNFNTDIEWMEEKNQINIKSEVMSKPIISGNKFDYNEGNIEYSINIPVITGLNDKNFEKQLNNSILEQKMEEIKQFVENAEKLKDDKDAKSIWKLNAVVTYKNNELISIVFDQYKKMPDGKELNYKETINIDLQSQKIIGLGDMFKKKKFQNGLEKTINYQQQSDEKLASEPVEIIGEELFFVKKGILVICKEIDNKQIEFEIPFIDLKKQLKGTFNFLITNK